MRRVGDCSIRQNKDFRFQFTYNRTDVGEVLQFLFLNVIEQTSEFLEQLRKLKIGNTRLFAIQILFETDIIQIRMLCSHFMDQIKTQIRNLTYFLILRCHKFIIKDLLTQKQKNSAIMKKQGKHLTKRPCRKISTSTFTQKHIPEAIIQSKSNQKKFYMKISVASSKNPKSLSPNQRDNQNQNRGNNGGICIVVKDKKDGILVEKEFERYFRKAQPQITMAPKHHRRIHTQYQLIENKYKPSCYGKKLSMQSQNSHRQAEYTKNKKMSEYHINNQIVVSKDIGSHSQRKSSRGSMYSRKRVLTQNLEFKDIAIVKKLQQKPNKQLGGKQQKNIEKIFNKNPINNEFPRKSTEKTIYQFQQPQKINYKSISPCTRIHTEYTKRDTEEEVPIFNQTLPTEIKLSKSIFIHEKNINFHNKSKNINLKLNFPKKKKYECKENSPRSRKIASSSLNAKNSRNGDDSLNNMCVGNRSVATHRNPGCKRTVNTPTRSNRWKKNENALNLKNAFQNYPLFPQYYHMKSMLNRPYTAKIQRNQIDHILNDQSLLKTEILNYQKIARKCLSANKSKKKSEDIPIGSIQPWEQNQVPQDRQQLFDLSFSSIHEAFHVEL